MDWSMLRSVVCRSGEVRVAGAPVAAAGRGGGGGFSGGALVRGGGVAAPGWAGAWSFSRSALIGRGRVASRPETGCWADQKSFDDGLNLLGSAGFSWADSNTRTAAVAESTHAEHTAAIRSELVGEAA